MSETLPHPSLTHLTGSGAPRMVDVSAKTITERTATAETTVVLPDGWLERLEAEDCRTAKGSVVETAILAGIQAAKQTGTLIPLCHILPLDSCRVEIETRPPDGLAIHCTAKATQRTGVEMEALTGASIAALTVYDMLKAWGHAMEIGPTRLVSKQGGRRDVGPSMD